MSIDDEGSNTKDCILDGIKLSFKLSIANKVMSVGISTPSGDLPLSNIRERRSIEVKTNNGRYEIAEKIDGDNAVFAITPIKHHQLVSETNKLSILTYDLWGISVNGSKKVQIRFDEMPQFFQNYDVLALEGLFDRKPTETLHTALLKEYPYQTAKIRQRGVPIQAGIYILSRYPIAKQDAVFYKTCKGFQCLATNAAIYTEIIKNGQKYHIFDTHIQSGNTDAQVQARMDQVTELSRFIQSQHIPKEEPIIIAGNFNIDMLHQPLNYQDMLTLLNSTHPDSTGYSLTYDSDVNKWADPFHPVHGYVDYLLYDNDHLTPISANLNVITPRSTIPALWNYWDLSSHFAVEGFFEYATPSTN
ncbi:MAG: sphingomyelin phosphodiesterase [Parashewanella sp.]